MVRLICLIVSGRAGAWFRRVLGGGGLWVDVGVGDRPEVEGLWRHGCAGRATVAGGYDVGKLVDGELPAADVDEGADYGAHHVAQKAVGGDDKHVGVGAGHGVPLGVGHLADVGAHVGVEFGKRGEVVGCEQQLCGAIHGLVVERGRCLPCELIEEWRGVGHGIVVVGARGGVEAGVSVGVNGYDALDGYVAPHERVERSHEAVGVGNRLVGVEVGHHHPGVDAGVGASGSGHGRWAAHDGRERFFDGLLHGVGVGLALPSVEGRAAIGEL